MDDDEESDLGTGLADDDGGRAFHGDEVDDIDDDEVDDDDDEVDDDDDDDDDDDEEEEEPAKLDDDAATAAATVESAVAPKRAAAIAAAASSAAKSCDYDPSHVWSSSELLSHVRDDKNVVGRKGDKSVQAIPIVGENMPGWYLGRVVLSGSGRVGGAIDMGYGDAVHLKEDALKRKGGKLKEIITGHLVVGLGAALVKDKGVADPHTELLLGDFRQHEGQVTHIVPFRTKNAHVVERVDRLGTDDSWYDNGMMDQLLRAVSSLKGTQFKKVSSPEFKKVFPCCVLTLALIIAPRPPRRCHLRLMAVGMSQNRR